MLFGRTTQFIDTPSVTQELNSGRRNSLTPNYLKESDYYRTREIREGLETLKPAILNTQGLLKTIIPLGELPREVYFTNESDLNKLTRTRSSLQFELESEIAANRAKIANNKFYASQEHKNGYAMEKLSQAYKKAAVPGYLPKEYQNKPKKAIQRPKSSMEKSFTEKSPMAKSLEEFEAKAGKNSLAYTSILEIKRAIGDDKCQKLITIITQRPDIDFKSPAFREVLQDIKNVYYYKVQPKYKFSAQIISSVDKSSVDKNSPQYSAR